MFTSPDGRCGSFAAYQITRKIRESQRFEGTTKSNHTKQPTQLDYHGAYSRDYLSYTLLHLQQRLILNITRHIGRGRNTGFPVPPAQIRTCGTTAYGSYLGCVA